MPILNFKKYYHLDADKIEPRDATVIHEIIPFDDAHYWYVEFFNDKSLQFLKEVIPLDVLDSIREGKIKLCLSNTHEAFNYVVSTIYYHVIKDLKIPEENILLISESANINIEIEKQAAYYEKKPIKSMWSRVFEHSVSSAATEKIKTLEKKTYNKKFLNLNRRPRIHRPMFVALAEIFNLRNSGFISLANSDIELNWTKAYNSLIEISKNNSTLNQLLINNKEKIENIPHMHLDTTDLSINKVEYDNSLDDFYKDSYFSVVSETNYYTEGKYGLMLSEKTFKAIAKCHPFILVSIPGTLSMLRSLGYKTFSPLIDESYDLEFDDDLRMLKIIKEVKRLSNLSERELTLFLKKAATICDYNFNHLTNQKTFFSKLT